MSLLAGIVGPFLSPESWPAENKMIGSMMIYEAENLEALRARIEADPYWEHNVVRYIFDCKLTVY